MPANHPGKADQVASAKSGSSWPARPSSRHERAHGPKRRIEPRCGRFTDADTADEIGQFARREPETGSEIQFVPMQNRSRPCISKSWKALPSDPRNPNRAFPVANPHIVPLPWMDESMQGMHEHRMAAVRARIVRLLRGRECQVTTPGARDEVGAAQHPNQPDVDRSSGPYSQQRDENASKHFVDAHGADATSYHDAFWVAVVTAPFQ